MERLSCSLSRRCLASLVLAVLCGSALLPFLFPSVVARDQQQAPPDIPEGPPAADIGVPPGLRERPEPYDRGPVGRAQGGGPTAGGAARPPDQTTNAALDPQNGAEPSATGASAAAAATAAPAPPAERTAARFAGALLFVLWVGFRMVPIAAGSRLERDAVREHPTRRRILDHLDRHPGETTMAIAEAAGVGCGRATYHLSILSRERLVRARRIDGRRRFFPTGAPRVPDEDVLLRDLARPARYTGRIVQILDRSPGTTLSELSRLLGMSPGQAHYHVQKLDDVGILYRVKRGRRVRHYLTETGHSLSARVQRFSVEGASNPVAA